MEDHDRRQTKVTGKGIPYFWCHDKGLSFASYLASLKWGRGDLASETDPMARYVHKRVGGASSILVPSQQSLKRSIPAP